MQTYRLMWGVVLMVAVVAAWVSVWVPPAFAQKAFVEVTGQTQCFDTSGNLIDCSSAAGTGQDGDIQAGVPFPTPRFSDRGNGTVRDNLTNLIWLKNANCSTISPAVWATALSNANSLASGQCGLSDRSVAGDWRLPNVKELQSLIDFGFATPALSNAAGTAKWTEGNAFSGVQSGIYWSSTTYADGPVNAWLVHLGDGLTSGLGVDVRKDHSNLVWPVRGGD